MELVAVLRPRARARGLFRDFERADSRPDGGCSAPPHSRRGRCGRTLCIALEHRLGPPVRALGVPAPRALARGVARVHFHHRHAGSLGLVLHVKAELMEGPTAQAAAHRALEPCPAADALENLEGYRTAGAFGTPHQRLGNTVAHVVLQARLASAHLLQAAPDVLRRLGRARAVGVGAQAPPGRALRTRPDMSTSCKRETAFAGAETLLWLAFNDGGTDVGKERSPDQPCCSRPRHVQHNAGAIAE